MFTFVSTAAVTVLVAAWVRRYRVGRATAGMSQPTGAPPAAPRSDVVPPHAVPPSRQGRPCVPPVRPDTTRRRVRRSTIAAPSRPRGRS